MFYRPSILIISLKTISTGTNKAHSRSAPDARYSIFRSLGDLGFWRYMIIMGTHLAARDDKPR